MHADPGASAPTETTMGLHQMPYEMVLLILHSLHTPEDLRNLLRACKAYPRYKDIYKRNSTSVNAAIMANAIHPAAMHDALAAIYCPQWGVPKDTTDDLEDFVERYFEGDEFVLPTEPEPVMRLCRLYSDASRLIKHYASQALELIGLGGFDVPVLSDVELARFQRAFFRYEVYCRAFPTANKTLRDTPIGYMYTVDDDEDLVSSDSQYSFFVSRFTKWEVEELTCVHRFYTGLAEKAWEDVEDQFFDDMELVTLDLETWTREFFHTGIDDDDDDDFPTMSLHPAYTRFHEVTVSMDDVADLDLNLLPRTVSNVVNMRQRYAFLASLGSSLMRRLITRVNDDVGNELVRDLVSHCVPIQHSWRDALEIQADFRGRSTPESIPNDIYNPGPEFPGPCYYILSPRAPNSSYLSAEVDEAYCPLRQRAYVFWDGDRVRDPRVIRGLVEARQMDFPALARIPSALDCLVTAEPHGRVRHKDVEKLQQKYSRPQMTPSSNVEPIMAIREYQLCVDEGISRQELRRRGIDPLDRFPQF